MKREIRKRFDKMEIIASFMVITNNIFTIFFKAFESVWNMMFGYVDLDLFYLYEAQNAVVSYFGRVLFILFMFLVVIVMTNMLIAIMADSFDYVWANLKAQTFKSIANVCVDLLISFNENHPLFREDYLHICTVKDYAEEKAMMNNQNEWEGRLKAVKTEIQTVRTKLETKMKLIEARG